MRRNPHFPDRKKIFCLQHKVQWAGCTAQNLPLFFLTMHCGHQVVKLRLLCDAPQLGSPGGPFPRHGGGCLEPLSRTRPHPICGGEKEDIDTRQNVKSGVCQIRSPNHYKHVQQYGGDKNQVGRRGLFTIQLCSRESHRGCIAYGRQGRGGLARCVITRVCHFVGSKYWTLDATYKYLVNYKMMGTERMSSANVLPLTRAPSSFVPMMKKGSGGGGRRKSRSATMSSHKSERSRSQSRSRSRSNDKTRGRSGNRRRRSRSRSPIPRSGTVKYVDGSYIL